ncbi:amidase signature domain-containing protein [Leucosporidium creatinivorum]|uniref:Amidase signature domain-containing protein n=1 Tax=Leucosporidium creatinivorum TaxID=106004 RepID=A0A1Y2FWK2_9BASI|nr:amidase signature domain-containing protein [Leucosporidium creatinivorum]
MLQLETTTNSPADVAEATLFPPKPSLVASTVADTPSATQANTVQTGEHFPASPSDVVAAAARLGFAIPDAHKDDYLQLLAATDRAAAALLDEPDHFTPVNLERFPRRDVHLPDDGDNSLRGWAWKCDIKGDGDLLSGRTVVAKDTVCVAEVPLRFGTDAFTGFVPQVDATIITRVLEHGGHFVGKAACENFSHGASSFSSPYGPVQNPHADGFSAGGSSSGCGALLGAGHVDLAIGGDQGGSIRIPASLCGVVGLKPTFGLVPYTGVLSSDAGSDHVGPMARNVLDAALLLEAIAGYDSIDDRQLGAPLPSDVPKYSSLLLEGRKKGLKGVKIGLLREGFAHTSLLPSVDAAVRAAVAKFEELGATVAEVSVPLHSKAEPLCHVLNKFSSSQTRQGRQVGRRGLYLNDYFDHLLPWDEEKYARARYFVSGTAMSGEYGWSKYPTLYGRAMNISRRLRDDYDAALAEFDVLVMPTVTQPARRHVVPDAGPLAWTKAAPGIVSNTSPFNLTGHPALTIPCGFTPPHPDDIRSAQDDSIRLPVGLMLVGKLFDESMVLRVGDAWQQAGFEM